MPRPTKDGAPARSARRRKLTELFVKKAKAEKAPFNVWDTHARGLVLRIQPTGHRSWRVLYRHHGRACWYHVGNAGSIGLADARRIAAKVTLAAAEGKDPGAERRAERGAGTVAELHEKYLEHAAKKNKSWRQAANLITRWVLPRIGRIQARDVTRADVKAMVARIAAPVLMNQVLAATSALFSWAMRQEIMERNPVIGIDRNPTASRERVLADSEVPKFWAALDGVDEVRAAALKFLLLTGQRPGEVAHMRIEHIVDGSWWQMPGEPVSALGWAGTKNAQSHRLWLSAPARAIVDAQVAGRSAGFVFASARGGPISGLSAAMVAICRSCELARATPHDLRRTFSTTVAASGFGHDALNRVTNHKEGGIASVYDRHGYADENKAVMERTAARIVELATGAGDANVVALTGRR